MSHRAPSNPELWVCHVGTIEYRSALALQERVRDARQAGLVPDVMLLLEHPPVYTRGRRSGQGELPMGVDWYLTQGIEIVDTDRGGKVTYHGPGQLVGYPIVEVEDVLAYVRSLERAIVRALAEEGITARARVEDGPDYTGVWVGGTDPTRAPTQAAAATPAHTAAATPAAAQAPAPAPAQAPAPAPARARKIASIGVHVNRGVTTHGFAVNVENDLQPFGWVVPCGLADVQMTSLIKETGRLGGQMGCFRKRMAYAVAQELGLRQRIVSLERLETALTPPPSPNPAAAVAATA